MEGCLAAKAWVRWGSPDLPPLFCTQLPPTPLPSNPELHNILLDKNLMRGQVTWLKACQVFKTWVPIPSPLFTSCMILGILLNLSEPRFLHLRSRVPTCRAVVWIK